MRRGTPMIRKLILLAAVAAVLGLAAFWFLTIPATVPASALGPHTPDLANGKDDVLRRRLRVLPCDAETAGPDQARRRAGAEFAVRHFLRSQYFVRPEGRHRRLERGAIRHRHDQGHLAGGRASIIRRFPTRPISTCAFDDLRDLFAYLKTLPAVRGTRARSRSAVSVQHPPHARRSGSCCFSTASRSSPIRRNRRNGTAAPIWSTAPATAPNVIRRATCSAA